MVPVTRGPHRAPHVRLEGAHEPIQRLPPRDVRGGRVPADTCCTGQRRSVSVASSIHCGAREWRAPDGRQQDSISSTTSSPATLQHGTRSVPAGAEAAASRGDRSSMWQQWSLRHLVDWQPTWSSPFVTGSTWHVHVALERERGRLSRNQRRGDPRRHAADTAQWSREGRRHPQYHVFVPLRNRTLLRAGPCRTYDIPA